MAKDKKFIPTVSVIIPMYNAEIYIEECLQSLLKQTLKNIEVIVVDDCSTDNSVAVVKKIESAFGGRLKLLKHKKNSGYPGLPRNTALKSANGKYIYFLDSDDFISETALEDFYKVAEEFNADVVHSEKYFEYNETEHQDLMGTFQKGECVTVPTLEIMDIGKRVLDFTKRRFLWWGCNKLFRRKFLIDNKIKFSAMKSYEDYVFVFCCVVTAKNYVRVPFVNYHYRKLENSLSHKIPTPLELTETLVKAVGNIDKFISNQKFFIDNPKYRYAIIDHFTSWRIGAISKVLFLQPGTTLEQLFTSLYEKIFSENPAENVAFISYIFIALNIYRLLSDKQEQQIAELKQQLHELQGWVDKNG